MAVNEKSFKNGHKTQNAGIPRNRVPTDFRKMLSADFDKYAKKYIKILRKMAFGGYIYTNGNGVTVTALPDKDWFRLALEYAKGKPIQLVDTDEDTKTALKIFGDFVSGVSGTKAVSSNGQLVDTAEKNADTEIGQVVETKDNEQTSQVGDTQPPAEKNADIELDKSE